MSTPNHCCYCGSNKLVLKVEEGENEDNTELWAAVSSDCSTEFDEELARYECQDCKQHFYIPA